VIFDAGLGRKREKLCLPGVVRGWTELSVYSGLLFCAMGSREIGRADGTEVLRSNRAGSGLYSSKQTLDLIRPQLI
jgi:hypothetical protein